MMTRKRRVLQGERKPEVNPLAVPLPYIFEIFQNEDIIQEIDKHSEYNIEC